MKNGTIEFLDHNNIGLDTTIGILSGLVQAPDEGQIFNPGTQRAPRAVYNRLACTRTFTLPADN